MDTNPLAAASATALNGLTIKGPVKLSSEQNQTIRLDGASVREAINSIQHQTSTPELSIAPGVTFSRQAIRVESLNHIDSKPQRIFQQSLSNPDEAGPSTDKLASQLHSDFSLHRLQGGGSRLAELFESGSGSYSQDIRSYSFFASVDKGAAPPKLNLETFKERSTEDNQTLNLTLKTKDGDTITFSLRQYEGKGKTESEVVATGPEGDLIREGKSAFFQGTEVKFEVDGELSSVERKQLAEFAKKLEGFSNKFFEDGKANLKSLDLTGFSVINKLELETTGGGQQPLQLTYQDSSEARRVSVSVGSDKAEINIDKTNQLIFNSGGKQQAIDHYLDLLDKGAKEAKGGRHQTNLMKDVFQLGFANTEEDQKKSDLEEGKRDTTIRLNPGQAKPGEQEKLSRDAFIPLADFSFNFSSHKSRPNQAHQPGEYSGFNIDLSLKNNQRESAEQTITEQKQHFKLKGAYYEPLPHLKLVDFENQNYQYTQVEREANKTTRTIVEDGKLIVATTEEEMKAEKQVLQYSEGKQIKNEITEDEFAKIKDISGLLLDKEQQVSQILQEVLIDPYQKS